MKITLFEEGNQALQIPTQFVGIPGNFSEVYFIFEPYALAFLRLVSLVLRCSHLHPVAVTCHTGTLRQDFRRVRSWRWRLGWKKSMPSRSESTRWLPSRELTYPLQKMAILKMIVSFSSGGIPVNFREGFCWNDMTMTMTMIMKHFWEGTSHKVFENSQCSINEEALMRQYFHVFSIILDLNHTLFFSWIAILHLPCWRIDVF